jgi:hypothetical protein
LSSSNFDSLRMGCYRNFFDWPNTIFFSIIKKSHLMFKHITGNYFSAFQKNRMYFYFSLLFFVNNIYTTIKPIVSRNVNRLDSCASVCATGRMLFTILRLCMILDPRLSYLLPLLLHNLSNSWPKLDCWSVNVCFS